MIFYKILLFAAYASSLNFKISNNNPQIVDAIVEIISNMCEAITSSIIFDSRCLSNNTFMDVIDAVTRQSSQCQKVTLQIEMENLNRKLVAVNGYKKCNIVLTSSAENSRNEILNSQSIFMHHESPLVIVLMEYHETRKIADIFNILWHANIYNVNILKNDMTVVTFFPFQWQNCNDTTPVTINRFGDGNFVNSTKNFFPNKMKNLQQCPINVATASDAQPYLFVDKFENGSFNLHGRDITLLNTLAEALNFKTNFTYLGKDVMDSSKGAWFKFFIPSSSETSLNYFNLFHKSLPIKARKATSLKTELPTGHSEHLWMEQQTLPFQIYG